MTTTSAMDPGDWIEVLLPPAGPEDSENDEAPILIFDGQVKGARFTYREGEPLPSGSALKSVLGYERGVLLSHHANMLLALCVARLAPELLRDLGFEIFGDGWVRLASFSMLQKFKEWAPALDGGKLEQDFQTKVRGIFKNRDGNKDERLIGFEALASKRWMRLRVSQPGQIRITTDVLEAIQKRLRASRDGSSSDGGSAGGGRAGGGGPNDRPFAELIAAVTALIDMINGLLAELPAGKRREVTRMWTGRLDRWFTQILNALQASNGRAALMKLFMVLAFGRQRPTREHIWDLLDAMGNDILDAVEVREQQARRSALRDLCFEALRGRSGSLTEETKARLDTASEAHLRGWLLGALDVKSLQQAIRPTPAPRAKARSERGKAAPTRNRPRTGRPKRPAGRNQKR